MKVTGPLFKWFGSKWLSSRLLPRPHYDDVIEPFAGGAGYSLRHSSKDVLLYEADGHIRNLWEWLIGYADEASIRQIPLDLKEGQDIRSVGLSEGQALLLKNWQRTNNVGDCWTISPWGSKPGQWTANTRARVSEEVSAIKHWKIGGSQGLVAFNHTPSTWFIDPPYQFNYKYRSKVELDYALLAEKARAAKGQVIVCEAVCQKTGKSPDYLPFEFWGSRITSRRKEGQNHHSKELIWSQHK